VRSAIGATFRRISCLPSSVPLQRSRTCSDVSGAWPQLYSGDGTPGTRRLKKNSAIPTHPVRACISTDASCLGISLYILWLSKAGPFRAANTPRPLCYTAAFHLLFHLSIMAFSVFFSVFFSFAPLGTFDRVSLYPLPRGVYACNFGDILLPVPLP
jgi:hypothetical protein